MPELLAVCVVHELHRDDGMIGVTAIDKRAQQHAVKIGRYGARGDVQADRKDHGGLDAALYAYADEDAAWWAGELLERLGERAPDELEPGWFGWVKRFQDAGRARTCACCATAASGRGIRSRSSRDPTRRRRSPRCTATASSSA